MTVSCKCMNNIVKKEVRFSWHIPKNSYRTEDFHYVKYAETCKCGIIRPVVKLIKDFKRPIFVTKQEHRNHKEKKEFEYIDKLLRADTTESNLNITVANLLGKPYLANNPDEIKNSPYVYGYDITSTSLIKYSSLKKNNFIQTPYSVAAFDIETDPNTGEIILASIAFNTTLYVAILEKFVKNIESLDTRLKNAFTKLIPESNKYKLEYSVCKNELSLIDKVFTKANELAPDFLAIWNMNFDIPIILDRIKYFNKNPIDYLCDKSIPREYRVCKYKKGINKKITASGVVKPISPSLQWHTLVLTAKFYVIDAMCVYRQLRMSKQEEPSYSLDAILSKELNMTKLKIEEAKNYSGIKWHTFMQEKFPVEYIIYNLWDVLSMTLLDNKIKDLSITLPAFSGITDFSRFNSNPKKIVDALFLFGLERNRIIGTVGKLNKKEEEILDEELDEAIDKENEEDNISKYKTLDLKNWIQTLPQDHLLFGDGLKIFEDYPNLVTNIRGVVCDLDASSAYPSSTLVSNLSKETTKTELIKIEGIKEEVFRSMNLSIPMGNANILEYFSVMFDVPDLISDIYNK